MRWLSVLMLAACLAACGRDDEASKPAADDTPTVMDKPVLENAEQVVRDAGTALTETRTHQPPHWDGATIPEENWPSSIRALKPARVVQDRGNVKIITAESGGAESGWYISVLTSSYAPDGKGFSRWEEAGTGVHAYTLQK